MCKFILKADRIEGSRDNRNQRMPHDPLMCPSSLYTFKKMVKYINTWRHSFRTYCWNSPLFFEKKGRQERVQHRRRIEIFDKNIYQEKKKNGWTLWFFSFFLSFGSPESYRVSRNSFQKTKFHNLHTASAQWRRATLKIYNNAETTDEQHT